MQIDKKKLHPPGTVEKQYEDLKKDLAYYLISDGSKLDISKVESVACAICGNAPDKYLFSKCSFGYYQCTTCDLVFPNPRPKQEFISQQYMDGRFARSFREIYLPSADYRMQTIFHERVHELIAPYCSSGKLLDIGCSSGHFLKVAELAGFECFGIEPSEEMALFAKNELLLENIKCGTLTEASYEKDSFDVITLWDVIEHVPQPSELLEIAFQILKPGGLCFAYTENFRSFNVMVCGERSEIFAPDVHLWHYTPESFKAQFSAAGFTEIKTVTKGLDLDHISVTEKIFKGERLAAQHLDENESSVFQELLNKYGIGDNLRLIAQKP